MHLLILLVGVLVPKQVYGEFDNSTAVNTSLKAEGCGGIDRSGGGLITAPEDAIRYRCVWHLYGRDNGRIKAIVQVASTVEGTQESCPANYLSLYDGDSESAPHSGPYSNDPYIDYATTGSVLTLVIVKANVTCSFFVLALYETKQGPLKQKSTSTEVTAITTKPSTTSDENFTITEGNITTEGVLTTITQPLNARNELSKSTANDTALNASLKEVKGCGGVENSGNGLINAPEDSVPYRCVWHLLAKGNGRLKAMVQVASTFPGSYDTCSANYLSLYDGDSENAPVSGPYSNDPYFNYETTGPAMTVVIVKANVTCSLFALVLYETVEGPPITTSTSTKLSTTTTSKMVNSTTTIMMSPTTTSTMNNSTSTIMTSPTTTSTMISSTTSTVTSPTTTSTMINSTSTIMTSPTTTSTMINSTTTIMTSPTTTEEMKNSTTITTASSKKPRELTTANSSTANSSTTTATSTSSSSEVTEANATTEVTTISSSGSTAANTTSDAATTEFSSTTNSSKVTSEDITTSSVSMENSTTPSPTVNWTCTDFTNGASIGNSVQLLRWICVIIGLLNSSA